MVREHWSESDSTEEVQKSDSQTIEQSNSCKKDNRRSLTAPHTTKIRCLRKRSKSGKPEDHLKCNYCGKLYVLSSGTKGALDHLRSAHPNVIDNIREVDELAKTKKRDEVALAMKNFFDPAKMKVPFDQDQFMNKLMAYLIKCNIAFRTVEDPFFVDMMEYVRDGILLNSRTTLMRKMKDMYEQVVGHFVDKLKMLDSKFSITLDVWTARNALSFLGVTMHYIDNNWNKCDLLLELKPLRCDHTGENLSKILIEILEKYQLTSRLLGVTVDNASNNSTMVEALEVYYQKYHPEAGFSLAWNKIECVAHVINLAAQEIMKPFKKYITNEFDNIEESNLDTMTTAFTRLSILVRKIRKSELIRRRMQE